MEKRTIGANKVTPGTGRPPKRSPFADALESLLTCGRFTKPAWSKILRVSESAISQWVNDRTIPRPELLRKLYRIVEGAHPPYTESIERFDAMAAMPAQKASPANGARMLPTVQEYVNRPTFDSLARKLRTLTTEEQEELLLQRYGGPAAVAKSSMKHSQRTVDEPQGIVVSSKEIGESSALDEGTLGQEESYSVEELLSSRFPLPNRQGATFVHPNLRRVADGASLSWQQFSEQAGNILLLGGMGIGKSYCLQQLHRERAWRDGQSERVRYAPLSKLDPRAREYSWHEVLSSLAGGASLLLLDGLDELLVESRELAANSIAAFAAETPEVHITVGSRPVLEAQRLPSSFARMTIEPFTGAQRQAVLWDTYREAAAERPPRNERTYFCHLAERPELDDVLSNPLLLRRTMEHYLQSAATPFAEHEVLGQCLSAFLQDWDTERKVVRQVDRSETPWQVRRLLSRFCYQGLLSEDCLLPIREITTHAQRRLAELSGMLEEADGANWHLGMRSMRDYLAALYVVESSEDACQLVSEQLIKAAEPLRLSRFLRLACSLTSDASHLLSFLARTEELASHHRAVIIADALAQPFDADDDAVAQSSRLVLGWLTSVLAGWKPQPTEAGAKRHDGRTVLWSFTAQGPSFEGMYTDSLLTVMRAVHRARSGPARSVFEQQLGNGDSQLLGAFAPSLKVDGRLEGSIVQRSESACELRLEVVAA